MRDPGESRRRIDNSTPRVISRVRDKIEQLEEDLEILNENQDTLDDELREIICDDNDN